MTRRLSGARLTLVLLALVSTACSQNDKAISILVASSLQDVVPRILAQSDVTRGMDLRVSYAASSTLARQLEAGAHADIFLSADTLWVDRLIAKGLLDGATRVDMIGNQLVLVASRARAPDLAPLPLPKQLAFVLSGDGRLAIGDPAHVPAGRYARSALERLALWDRVQTRCAFADNVRAALTLVTRGEAPLGIVYATDVALDTDAVIVGRFPADPQAPIVYSFAQASAHARAQVDDVFRALTDEAAARAYRDAGFVAL